MAWSLLLIRFLAGIFLANGIPHFVHGVSGKPFPSPFAQPPGVGNSSPVVNVLWGSANFVGGYNGETAALALGALTLALGLAWHFGRVQAARGET